MSNPADTGSAIALCAPGATTGANVLSLTLSRPLWGVGALEAELDVGEAQPPADGSAQVLAFAVAGGAPVTYACTIVESRPHVGRASVFAVLGAGGMRGTVAAVDYAEVAPSVVVADLLRDAGEVGDPAALAALANLPHLPRWSRPAGIARAAMGRLVDRIGQLVGASWNWRITRAGQVWLGAETWPAYVSTTQPSSAAQPYYTEEPDARGIGTVALDAPDLDPGSTVLPPDDQVAAGPLRISSVVHTVTEDGVARTRVTIAETVPGKGRERNTWKRAVEGALPPQSLRVPWFATVVSQDADGAVGIRLEDGAPMLTLSGVPLWLGLPGYLVEVPGGAQCIVEFVGGREDKPVVRAFAQETPFTTLTVGRLNAGGTTSTQPFSSPAHIARQYDFCARVILDSGHALNSSTSTAPPYAWTPVPVSMTSPPDPTEPGVAITIETGAPFFKAGF